MAKIYTIRLAQHEMEGRPQWKVLQVTDSILYVPNEWLEKDVVVGLCNGNSWKVTFTT